MKWYFLHRLHFKLFKKPIKIGLIKLTFNCQFYPTHLRHHLYPLQYGSWGRVPTPKVGVLMYYFADFPPKTAWKWKNVDPEAGRPGAPLDPPVYLYLLYHAPSAPFTPLLPVPLAPCPICTLYTLHSAPCTLCTSHTLCTMYHTPRTCTSLHSLHPFHPSASFTHLQTKRWLVIFPDPIQNYHFSPITILWIGATYQSVKGFTIPSTEILCIPPPNQWITSNKF